VGKRETVPLLAPFQGGLRDLGYIERGNIDIAYRFGDNDYERLPVLAQCPSEEFLIPSNHLDSMEPLLIRRRGFHCGRTGTGRSTTAIT